MEAKTGQCAPNYGLPFWQAVRDLQRLVYGRWEWESLHPDVEKCGELARPHDWHALALEVPRESPTGKGRVRYFRTREDHTRSKYTETSLAKYLARHFKGILPDHYFRDLVMQYSTSGMYVTADMDEMVEVIETGPCSCMQGYTRHRHLYRAYRPDLGWSMLVRRSSAGEVITRALLHTDPAGVRRMVRAYGVWESAHAWCAANAVQIVDAWPAGARLALDTALGGPPFVDGCAGATLSCCGGYFVLTGADCDDDEYDLQNTETTAELYQD